MKVLRELYSRGLFLTVDEVLNHTGSGPVSYDGDLAARRLDAWRDVATAGDLSLFCEFLHGRGIDYDSAARRLGEQPVLSEPLPSWLEVLIGTIEIAMCRYRSLSLSEVCEHARPFGYITEVLVLSAESLRDASLSKVALERFLPKARSDLRDHLCDRIEAILVAPLYQSFKSWVQSSSSNGQTTFKERSAANGEDVSHLEFLSEFFERGLEALWSERPVLALLLGKVFEQWMISTRELIERFNFSQQSLQDFVGGSPRCLVVEGVRCGLSDLHHAGRSVCILSIQGGARLVYKPRSVSAEAAWERFVEWIDERLPSTTLKPMQVLDCKDYGWCEFVQGPSAVNREQAQAFFHRAGVLLGLLHLMAATDMHEENLIACGEYPVLVDLEMILQPRISKEASAGAEPLRAILRAQDLIADSVLETGLLPMIVKTPETATIGQGGLSHHALFGPRRLGWTHVNRCDMAPRLELGGRLLLSNLPQVDGISARLQDYWGPFKRGVEDGLRVAMFRKSELLRPGGPLELFKGIPIRIILRPTRYYEMLLRRLLDFRRMSDTQAWSCQADFSSRFELSPVQPIWPAKYARREREDLLALNVPRYEVASDGHLEPDPNVSAAARQSFTSGYERARARIAQLNEARIQEQLSILELSALAFDITRSPENNPRIGTGLRPTSEAAGASSRAADEKLFREEIERISGLLKRSAIREAGGCTWLGLTPVGDTDAIALRPLGHALYDGTTGVALLLAAASVAVEDQECRALCLEALAPTRWYLKHESAAGFARTLGMGGTGGIGSVIYALTSTAQILSAPELLEDAIEVSRLITDRMISGDRTFDISRGSAGTLLALLRLHADTHERSVLERARECAEHLLRHRPAQPHALWKRSREPAALTGMSHGASGFALAFFRLHRVTGDDRYAQVVRDCLEYERSVFSQKERNWPDLRPTDPKKPVEYPVRWCHGAIGIAFARRALIEGGFEDALLGFEYQVALETSFRFGGYHNDSLCCGNIGAIALLMRLVGGGAPEVAGSYSDRLLADLILQAREGGSYRWQGGRDDHNPGLFRGISGIGYIIARRLVGEALPDVLTLS